MPHTRKLTPHHRTPPILLQPSPMPTPTNANPKSIPTPPLRVQTVVVKGKKHRFFIFGVSLCSPSPLFFSPVLRFILSKLVLGLGLDDFFKRCTQSIGAVCNLKWPKSKILIQVLDDSDDPTTQLLIKDKVHRWKTDDANIVCRHRVIRDGYKAGNLKSAMNCRYVKDYEFVAIFDADFQPNPDFLMKTVSHFKDNEELGLEQARWSFVIRDGNLLTRLQQLT